MDPADSQIITNINPLRDEKFIASKLLPVCGFDYAKVITVKVIGILIDQILGFH